MRIFKDHQNNKSTIGLLFSFTLIFRINILFLIKQLYKIINYIHNKF